MILIIYYTKSCYLLFWVVLNTTVLYEAVDGSWNAAHSLWWATDRSLGVSWQYNVIRGARASWANGKRRHILITRSERKKNRALLWLRLIRKQRERGEVNKWSIYIEILVPTEQRIIWSRNIQRKQGKIIKKGSQLQAEFILTCMLVVTRVTTSTCSPWQKNLKLL